MQIDSLQQQISVSAESLVLYLHRVRIDILAPAGFVGACPCAFSRYVSEVSGIWVVGHAEVPATLPVRL